MGRIAIVTDSTCCLPAELVARYSIHVVPLLICIGGKSHRDNVDITPQEVYKIMRRDEDLPTTSVPTPDDFSKAFVAAGKEAEGVVCITLTGLQSKTYETAVLAKKIAEEAEGIVCITLTGLQSKTYETAVLAKKIAEEAMPKTAIEVIDSRAVSGALGFTVLEAARAAESGADLKGVCAAAHKTMAKINFLAMVDTLHFLARTGRIARAAAWAGAVLNMKPVLEHSTAIGETSPFARPRSKAKAVELMLQTMAERMGNSTIHVLVHHADELEEGEKLKSDIARRFKCAELYLTEFTPIMGVHAGPGVLAVAFWKEDAAPNSR